ncbi:hypothetical protein COHA_006131 [Chlorella ohadii]|uniref:RRM domain-containing protein n=1 Tax=Chlorella ohadii TaxID=2649997 RepID=A0AAD5H185_9CHLO|nr:hypothetical protein COHA_006131 [Chlorella ohadii]
MGRSRSRSRSRGRRRSRSRDRRRSRSPAGGGHRGGGGDTFDRSRLLVTDPGAAMAMQQTLAAQMQQQQLAAMQQQELQKQLLAQQMMMPGGLAAAAGGAQQSQLETLHRKQREVYIGNLAIGIITKDLLQEFWDQVFAHAVPDPVNNPPVANINMDPGGRFAFVEFQKEELASKALEMDRVVELCGRAMHIGRPKGYVPPAPGEVVPDALPRSVREKQEQEKAAAVEAGGAVAIAPTTTLLLTSILPAGQLRTESERRILQEEVYEEAAKYGNVSGVYVAIPTAQVQDLMPGRCYIKYGSVEDAKKGHAVFHGRTLDGNVIKASYVPEDEYSRAAAGEWVSKASNVAGIPLPGLYTMAPLVSGITGLSALNPSLAALVSTNPGIAGILTAGVNEDEPCAPELAEEDVKMVLSADGTSLGEAFVHLRGGRAKLRLALAKDRSVMPTTHTPVEVLTAVEDDMQRRMFSGCMLV